MSTTILELAQYYKDKKVLVTGGTGSIGEQIVSTLLDFKPTQIIILSRDDSKQYLLQQKFGNLASVKFHLGDIRDFQSVEDVMKGIDIVFHAAALKQVPICEDNPFEAIKTNILGSENVIRAAIQHNVKRVVNISTDKAVNPTNTMGATKLLSEKLFRQANLLLHNHITRFSSVRFGNVIGSRGSVIPLFIDQLRSGGPITITDPKMTRFFMSISEAVLLTLKAGYYTQGGETFILKMKSIRLRDLMKAVKEYGRLKGFQIPKVKIIGKRLGEKLYEELLYKDEVNQIFEDHELYAVLSQQHQTKSHLHFKPCSIKTYRSDKVQTISTQEIIGLLTELDLRRG